MVLFVSAIMSSSGEPASKVRLPSLVKNCWAEMLVPMTRLIKRRIKIFMNESFSCLAHLLQSKRVAWTGRNPKEVHLAA